MNSKHILKSSVVSQLTYSISKPNFKALQIIRNYVPDSPIIGSSDEDKIVDLMKRTAFFSQGPGFESRYQTYENLSLLP